MDKESGQAILPLENIPAWSNNDYIKTLQIKISKEELEEIKGYIFDNICRATKVMLAGNELPQRVVEAYRRLEQGDYNAVDYILDYKKMDDERKLDLQEFERVEKDIAESKYRLVKGYYDGHMLGAKVAYSIAKTEHDYTNVEGHYEIAQQITEEFNLETDVAFEYAEYLYYQNRGHEAVNKLEQELARVVRLAETNPDYYLPSVASVLNDLANFQTRMADYTVAYENSKKSLTLFTHLAETYQEFSSMVERLTNETENLHSIVELINQMEQRKLEQEQYTEDLWRREQEREYERKKELESGRISYLQSELEDPRLFLKLIEKVKGKVPNAVIERMEQDFLKVQIMLGRHIDIEHEMSFNGSEIEQAELLCKLSEVNKKIILDRLRQEYLPKVQEDIKNLEQRKKGREINDDQDDRHGNSFMV